MEIALQAAYIQITYGLTSAADIHISFAGLVCWAMLSLKAKYIVSMYTYVCMYVCMYVCTYMGG